MKNTTTNHHHHHNNNTMNTINININTAGTQEFMFNGKKITVTVKEPVIKTGDTLYTVNNNRIKVLHVISKEDAIRIRPDISRFGKLEHYTIDHNGNVQGHNSHIEEYVAAKKCYFKTKEEAIKKITDTLNKSLNNNTRYINHYMNRHNISQ